MQGTHFFHLFFLSSFVRCPLAAIAHSHARALPNSTTHMICGEGGEWEDRGEGAEISVAEGAGMRPQVRRVLARRFSFGRPGHLFQSATMTYRPDLAGL